MCHRAERYSASLWTAAWGPGAKARRGRGLTGGREHRAGRQGAEPGSSVGEGGEMR